MEKKEKKGVKKIESCITLVQKKLYDQHVIDYSLQNIQDESKNSSKFANTNENFSVTR